MQNLTQVVVGVVLALVANWQMALLQLVGIPCMLVVQIFQRPILAKIATKISQLSGGSVATANEVITSMRTVRSMAGEEKEVKRYSKELDRVNFLGFFNALTKGLGIMFTFFLVWGCIGLYVTFK